MIYNRSLGERGPKRDMLLLLLLLLLLGRSWASGWLAGWLAGWLTGWLAGWLPPPHSPKLPITQRVALSVYSI